MTHLAPQALTIVASAQCFALIAVHCFSCPQVLAPLTRRGLDADANAEVLESKVGAVGSDAYVAVQAPHAQNSVLHSCAWVRRRKVRLERDVFDFVMRVLVVPFALAYHMSPTLIRSLPNLPVFCAHPPSAPLQVALLACNQLA